MQAAGGVTRSNARSVSRIFADQSRLQGEAFAVGQRGVAMAVDT